MRPHAFLPAGAVKVGSIAAWDAPTSRSRPFSPHETFFWTSTGDIIHQEKNADGSTAVLREHLTPSHTLQRDAAPPTQISANSYFLQSTPDGSGLLYAKTNAIHNHDVDLHLLSADGKSDRLLAALWMPFPVWMPDGKHWLVTRTEGDYLNSLDGTPLRRLDTASLSPWTPFMLGVNPQSHAIATIGNDYFEAPDSAPRFAGVNYPAISLMEFDPAAPARHCRKWSVRVPTGSFRGQILLSTQADRILWIVEKPSPAITQWIDRHLRGHKTFYGDQKVYVSRLDGSEMQELLSAPVEKKKWGKLVVISMPFSNIHWLSDSKRISFVYHTDLYLAPIK